MVRSLSTSVIIVLCSATISLGCLWDYDTLQQERSRFPSTLELITGKFLRHSDDFYRWRIEDRRRRLESDNLTTDEKLALYDDIAVASDKLGDPEQAIAVMHEKQEIRGGDYETLANLGTFHIHAGRLEEGAEYIRQAIEVNPDAHFGREVYQLKLVEYVLSRQADEGSLPLPLNADDERYAGATVGFAAFLGGDDDDENSRLSTDEQAAALKGVQGMMRFGRHDSPILLEVLGDLLASGEMTSDARQLAARAYLRASQEVDDESAADAYRGLAGSVAANQFLLSEARREPGQSREDVASELAVIEAEFAAELEDANEWIAALHAEEQQWIADSDVNPEVEFARHYDEAPTVATPNTDQPRMSPDRAILTGLTLIAVIGAVLMVGVVLLVWRFLKRRRQSHATLTA